MADVITSPRREVRPVDQGGTSVVSRPLTGVRLQLPTVRTSGADTQLDQATRVGLQSGQVGARIQEIAQAEQARANKLRLYETSNSLSSISASVRQRMQDLRGADAIGSSRALLGEFDQKWSSEVATKLANRDQRDLGGQLYSSMRLNLERDLQAHEHREYNIHRQREAVRFIANNEAEVVNSALSSHEDWKVGVVNALNNQAAVIQDLGDSAGKTIEQVRDEVTLIRSKTHSKAAKALVDSGRLERAKEYMDLAGDELSKEDRAAIGRVIKVAEISLNADAVTEQLMQQDVPETEAIKMVSESYEDDDFRDEIQRRVRYAYKEKRRIETLAIDEAFKTADEIIKANPGVIPSRSVPPSVWGAIPRSKQRTLMRDYGFTKSGKKSSSKAALVDVYEISATPGALSAIGEADFREKISSLSDSDKIRAIGLRSKDLNRKEPAEKSISESRINLMIKNAWSSIGGDPTSRDSEKREAYARFMDNARSQIDLATKGGAITDEVARSVVDGLVKEKVFRKTWLGFGDDEEVLALKVPKDEAADAFVPFESITDREMQFIQLRMKREKRKLSNFNMQRLAAALRMRNSQLFDDILAGKE